MAVYPLGLLEINKDAMLWDIVKGLPCPAFGDAKILMSS